MNDWMKWNEMERNIKVASQTKEYPSNTLLNQLEQCNSLFV